MHHHGLCDTPIGPVVVRWSPAGISAVRRPADTIDFGDTQDFSSAVDPGASVGGGVPSPVLKAVERQIKTGEPAGLDFDLAACSCLQRDVLLAMATIPYGQVRSYSWLAAACGRPRAVRAVASAVGRNPIPLLFPCHRVVRADGAVGAFGWGAAVKLALLRHEGAPVDGDRWL